MNHLNDENIDWFRWLEKRVCVKNKLVGTLKYFGSTKFSKGLWCGIELDEPVGKNDGTVNNVQYFTCPPKFGIFVPVDKVHKINDSKNLDNTYTLHATFEVQNCREKTIILSSSTDLEYNKENKEIDCKESKTLKIRQDSEESLGILDLKLIDSANISDSLILDTAGDIVSSFRDSLFIFDEQKSGFLDRLPVSDLVSNEISYPKYASTPRHPVQKKIIDFGDTDLPLQNINEDVDVFDNQMNFTQDFFFDNEKFRNNPKLTSTCEIHQLVNTSPSTNEKTFSPIQSNPASQAIDLNKTCILPLPSINDQEIIPVSTDLNKTQTIQNKCKTSNSNSVETKDLNLTVSLQVREGSGSYQQSCQARATANIISTNNCTESKDGNLTFSLETKEESKNLQKFCQAELISDVSEPDYTETEDFSMQLKANNADGKVVQFKRPLSFRSSIRKSKAPLKNIALTVSKKENSNLKESVSVKPLASKMNLKNSKSSVDMKSDKQEKDKNLNAVKNKSAFPRKSLACNMNSKNGVNSNDVKVKKGRLSSSFDLDNKSNRPSTCKSRYSRRFSYSQNEEITGLSNTTSNLPLQNQGTESLKNASKIKFLSTKVLPANDVNGDNASKVPLNNEKNVTIVKNSLVSQLKKPATKNTLNYRPSLGLSSNECGISRRNSLAPNPKTNLPVGIIKPRYSMLQSIKEKNLSEAKNDAIDGEKPIKSCDDVVPKDVPTVSHQNIEAHSSKTTRIASSLPQKSQIASRMGQKLSDIKEGSGAPPKIPRYNLRGKK